MLRRLPISLILILSVFAAADHEMVVNYDIGQYKLLHVGETLELICKNKLNRNPPSWTYHSRLYRDPRMKLFQDFGESRLVISNATAEDAGQYGCGSDHEFNGKTFHFNRTIEVIAIAICRLRQEQNNNTITLKCDVRGYPQPTVIWKIDYDNKEYNPQPEEPDLEDEYWVPPEEKVVVDKSEGRFTLGTYKGVNNAELIIADVTENDSGTYYCVAKSIAGRTVNSTKIYIERGAKPDMLDPKISDQEGMINVTVVVTVVATIVVLAVIFGTVAGFRIYWIKNIPSRMDNQLERCSIAEDQNTPTDDQDSSSIKNILNLI